MGVPVLVQKNYTDFYLYLATEGWLDGEILCDFLVIFFPFREKLKTQSQELFAFNYKFVCVCIINVPTKPFLFLTKWPYLWAVYSGKGFLEGAVQQCSSLGFSFPGDKVHTELAITFPNPLLEVEGREMWVKFTTIVCFKSLNCVPFLKFVYGLYPVYRTCRILEGNSLRGRRRTKEHL
jgi:hypothetical protein